MKFFSFKDESEAIELTGIHPVLGVILFDMVNYCTIKNLPFKVTCVIRTLEENIKMKAVSLTHVEGRAFDISIQGWDLFKIDEFCIHFNRKYMQYAKPVALFHEGTAPHIHVQVFRNVSMVS